MILSLDCIFFDSSVFELKSELVGSKSSHLHCTFPIIVIKFFNKF